MDNISTEALLANYLFQKHQHIKQQLFKPLKDNYGDIEGMNEILKTEMVNYAKWILATEMAVKLHLSIDVIMDFLQNVNIEELLK